MQTDRQYLSFNSAVFMGEPIISVQGTDKIILLSSTSWALIFRWEARAIGAALILGVVLNTDAYPTEHDQSLCGKRPSWWEIHSSAPGHDYDECYLQFTDTEVVRILAERTGLKLERNSRLPAGRPLRDLPKLAQQFGYGEPIFDEHDNLRRPTTKKAGIN